MKKWMLPLLVGLMLSLTACGENQDARLPAAGDAQSAGGEKEVWQLSIGTGAGPLHGGRVQ